MENNVLSWAKALAQGLEPRSYSFAADAVPIGECTAILDFKIWAKYTMGISCYFSEIDTGRKFQLTVYLDPIYQHYFIRDVPVNFANCPLNEKYLVRVGSFGKEKPKLQYAEIIP